MYREAMRVVAGDLRGRRIEAPPGSETRPTTDRVREAVFNSLYSHGLIEEASVLDLFAGSGALGIEALSRGAAHATFVEQSRIARSVLEENLASLELGDRSTVVNGDGTDFASKSSKRVDLALLDPPYEFDQWDHLLTDLKADTAVIEVDHEVTPPSGWVGLRSRRYGGTLISIIRRIDAPRSDSTGSGVANRSSK